MTARDGIYAECKKTRIKTSLDKKNGLSLKLKYDE